MRRIGINWLALSALLGCGAAACGLQLTTDAGTDAVVVDNRRADATPPPDGAQDSGAPDTGAPDTGTPDTGAPDTGAPDTGTLDTGVLDTGTPDMGTLDSGPRDTGASDAPTGDVSVASVCGSAINLTTAGTLVGATTRYTGTTT